MSRLNFKLERESTGSQARAARFQTLHGEVQTPLFMPVGTQATVKGQTIHTLKATGARILLANTYHLLLRPGPEVFKKIGGIHRFMNWDGPVLTDSGGVQEETTALGVPCVTMRGNTERPITIEEGTNTLVGTDREILIHVVDDIIANGGKRGRVPEYWDGRAAERIASHMASWLCGAPEGAPGSLEAAAAS